jgi:hypothetical protein
MNFTKEEAEYIRHWLHEIKTPAGRQRHAKENFHLLQYDSPKYEMQDEAQRKYTNWMLHCHIEEEKIYQRIYGSHNEWHEATQVLNKFRLNANR